MLEAQTELKASAAIRASPTEFGAATFAKVNVANLAPTPEILGVIKAKTAVVCGPEAEGGGPPPAVHHAEPVPLREQGYGGGYGGGGGEGY